MIPPITSEATIKEFRKVWRLQHL